ncbi:MAG: hypothetical protein L0Y71_02010 [Gemmataceae bacterium]|nr:hypothetical protein [Gemmataceae bacterium]
MFGLGAIEVLMILFMSGGAMSADLVSVLPAQAYFKARGIDITIDKAVELAAKDPVDGKTQIAQLLALRYLADESAKLKASPNVNQHRQAIADIATGKKAQDPQGFAKDYAAQALAQLEGKKGMPPALPALRDDAFGWFPANATLVGALDTRMTRGDAPVKSNVAETFKMFPEQMLNQAFTAVENVGNVRIDRVAFAYVDNPQDKHMGEIYVRITGKGNPAWLLGGLKELKLETKTSKGPGGETLTTLLKPNNAPALMLIGDSELVVAGYQKEQANHEDLLAKVLELKGGKGRHAGQGVLKAELAKVPPKACGLVVGSLPAEAAQGAPFPMPVMITGHLLRVRNALDVNVAGHMAGNDEALQLVKTVSQGRQQGIDSLKQLQGAPIPVPGLQVNSMIQMLESMQVEAQGNVAKLRLLMPDDMLGGGAWFGMRVGAAPPLPPPPPKDKK